MYYAARPSFSRCQPISVDLSRSTVLVVKATAAATDTSFTSKRVEEKCVNFAWRDSYIAMETRGGVVQVCHLVVFVSTQSAERRVACKSYSYTIATLSVSLRCGNVK